MKKMIHAMRTTVLFVIVLLLAGGYPLGMTASADDTPSTTVIVPSSTPTTATTPAPSPPKPTYIYNAATGHWDSTTWQYDPATGTYVPTPQPVPTAAPPVPVATDVVTPSSGAQPAGDKTATTGLAAAATSTTVTNNLGSDATSGSAAVTGNQVAGSATSGDASSTATVINTVNSLMSNSDNQKAATFVSNIMGDVQGDIVLQPMLLKAMLEADAAPAKTTAIVITNNQLTNNLTLNATSGSALVSNNTTAGSATSGTANTVANVVNIVNSMISANQSFVGTINIYGNLNGDILIAPGFIPQLLASNSSTISPSQLEVTSPVVNASDTQAIINNVSLAAASGAAAVLGNTSAGAATTGDARTNTVIFNLSGHQIVASDSLLVFVNVLGTWVGVIVDAPSGTTSAALGDGVTTSSMTQPDMVLSSQNNTQLINNVTLASQSGDASVLGNTGAGNALTGNATASANIANISGSQIGLSGWFGIIFINVFGSWYGSFGIDTSAGNPLTGSSVSPVLSQAIAFVPHGSLGVPLRLAPGATVITTNQVGSYVRTLEPAVLAASAHGPATAHTSVFVSETPTTDFRLPIVIGTLFIIGVSFIGLKRFLR